MTIELRPLGVKCNIQCLYCYQHPQRDAGNVTKTYNLDRIKSVLEAENSDFTLFGGEPLLMPLADLEELWSWGFEKYGRNGIQTNGVLITDNHIRLFKEYNVRVGVSVDGPGLFNDVRWVGSLERTQRATAKTHAAIEKLCQHDIPPSIIVTLHRANATDDKLPAMCDWFRHLDKIGVRSVRLHVLEVEYETLRAQYALTSEESLRAFLCFAQLERDELASLRFTEFRDMEKLLRGQDNHTTCIWNACDPYTTRAVRGVEGNGQRSNCGRTNKEGVDFVKSDKAGYERYIALYHTPHEYGGCKDCRFFLVCKGQCPGTAIDGDWRNRTEHCELWQKLYEHYEARMLQRGELPLSRHPDRKTIESAFLERWSVGENPMIESLLSSHCKTGADTTWVDQKNCSSAKD